MIYANDNSYTWHLKILDGRSWSRIRILLHVLNIHFLLLLLITCSLYITYTRELNEIFLKLQVISALLATAVGAGLAISIEFKRFFDQIFDASGVSKEDATRSTNNKFYVRGIVASSVLLVAFLAMFVVSVLSSFNRNKKGIFGWWYYFLNNKSVEVEILINTC